METYSTSTEGFRNNGSRKYGMRFSTTNIIQASLSTMLEYTGILRGRPNYHEIDGTGWGSIKEIDLC